MAKSGKMRRKELVQPDQFISATDTILAYCSKHKNGLISIVTTLVLVVCLGLWLRYNQNVKNLEMESLYFQMEQVRTANGASPKKIISEMESILNEFSEGPQKQRAILIFADQLYNTHEYNRAISLYKDILNKTSPKKLQYKLASAGMAYSLEGKKDYKGAIIAYKTMIENQSKYPLFYAYLGLARCYELDKDQNGALLTLREMKNRFPNHPKLRLVDVRLKKLET